MADLIRIARIIKELEDKKELSGLNVSDAKRLSRYRTILNKPEVEKARYQKIKHTNSKKPKSKRKPSKWGKVNGVIYQGYSEKWYLENLLENNFPFPKRGTKIKLPDDSKYEPDFEFEDHFVEVKSELTFDMLIGKRRDYQEKFSIDQLEKIVWTAKNIKQVIILVVVNNRYVDNIILVDKKFQINDIIESGIEYEKRILLSKERRNGNSERSWKETTWKSS